jgi:alkylhydroperoxidase family enzyme
MGVLTLLEAEDLLPEHRDLIASGLNLHKTTAHSPQTARWSQGLGGHLRHTSPLNSRLRELGILQVTSVLGYEYEYAQHLWIGREFGLSDRDLASVALETREEDSGLEPIARLVMRAGREMALGRAVTPATMRELSASMSPEHLVDLVFALSFYVGFGCLTASFEIEIEPDRRALLDRFPMQIGSNQT